MSEHNLSAGLSGKLEQHLTLTQNQRRSLEVLAMPVTDLAQAIRAEMAVNPMLEEVPVENSALPEREETPNSPEDENDYESNSILSETWSDELPLPQDLSTPDDDNDGMSYIPAPPPQLKTLLMQEIAALDMNENFLRIAMEIISAVNDDGYLAIPLADLAMLCDADMDDMEDVLHTVQNAAPAGVGARTPAECLKLQLERQGKLTPLMKKLLDEGLEDIENRRFSALEKRLQVTRSELDAMLNTLRTLNPFPGREYAPESGGEFITPDITIFPGEDGTYKVSVRRERELPLRVSPLYEKLLENRNLPEDDRKYLTGKLSAAREFVQALINRGGTLLKLGEFIAAKQKDFLDNGVEQLRMLTMKEAAQALNLSESTISRAAAGKFADTPRGVFPLKFFFPSGGAAELSNQAVLEKIKSLIAEEDPAFPLSDDSIADMLKKDGVSIARRTVAKYRDMLKIPSASKRKER